MRPRSGVRRGAKEHLISSGHRIIFRHLSIFTHFDIFVTGPNFSERIYSIYVCQNPMFEHSMYVGSWHMPKNVGSIHWNSTLSYTLLWCFLWSFIRFGWPPPYDSSTARRPIRTNTDFDIISVRSRNIFIKRGLILSLKRRRTSGQSSFQKQLLTGKIEFASPFRWNLDTPLTLSEDWTGSRLNRGYASHCWTDCAKIRLASSLTSARTEQGKSSVNKTAVRVPCRDDGQHSDECFLRCHQKQITWDCVSPAGLPGNEKAGRTRRRRGQLRGNGGGTSRRNLITVL